MKVSLWSDLVNKLVTYEGLLFKTSVLLMFDESATKLSNSLKSLMT